MKSTLLTAALLSASVFAFAQKVQTPAAGFSKNQAAQPVASAPVQQFGSRDVIWTNDFSNAADWAISNGAGNNDNWVIGTAGPAGQFFIDPIASTTAANGFALFDSDVLCSGNQIANLTTANAIDCSTFPQVVLEFQQYYRRFVDSTFVFVSNDGGNAWTKYAVNEFLANNDFSNGNPETVRINITPTAGGQADVRVRFQFYSVPGMGSAQSPPGCGYSWMVDDVALVTPPAVDVTLNQVYTNDIFVAYEQYITPLAQADTVRVGTIIQSAGALDLNNSVTVNYSIKRGAVEVNAGSYTIANLNSFAIDTTFHNTGYVPDAVGTYSVDVTIVADGDASAGNDALSGAFEISDFIYSGVNPVATGMQGVTYGGTAAPFRAYKIGSTYVINNAADLIGFNFAVSRAADSQPMDITIELYETGNWAGPLAIYDFTIAGNHPNTFNATAVTTRAFDAPVTLNPGSYTIVMGYADTDRAFSFWCKDGDDDLSSWINGPFGSGGTTGWFVGLDLTPYIQLNFNPDIVGVAPIEANGMSVRVYPNPVNEALTVNMNFDNATATTLNLLDLNGRVISTRTVNNQTVATEVFNTAELANGVYTLQVISNNNIMSRRVVVAH
jgi:hypothetical protein